MTYLEHLAELRKRLLAALLVFVASSGAAFARARHIADIVMQPAQSLQFVYLSPPDLFLTYVKLALSVGLVASLPFAVYQLWMFVAPALGKKERRSILVSLAGGALLFVLGALFAFFVIIPFTLKFFLGYSSDRISPMISIDQYLSFMLGLLVSFGLAFELPVAVGLLGALGVLKPDHLAKARRLAILAIFVVAAVLTPPDVISQILLALPMLGLYEFSILILKRQERKRANKSLEA